MSSGLRNVLNAAVVATAGFFAVNAADAANPAVEARALPTYSANLTNSAVVPTTPENVISAPAAQPA